MIVFAVGDECLVVGLKGTNKNNPNFPYDYRRVTYGDRIANSVYTPAMIAFVREQSSFLGYFPTPTCDKPRRPG